MMLQIGIYTFYMDFILFYLIDHISLLIYSIKDNEHYPQGIFGPNHSGHPSGEKLRPYAQALLI